MTTRPAIFKWRQTEPQLILCAVRWYLRYSLSLRDVEELLEERGLEADHTTVWRWVQRYGPEFDQRLRRHLKPTNKSWRVDETYVRVKGRWCYLYRAIDSAGATIDFLLSALPRCRCRQTAVSQGSERPFASSTPRHQHGSGAHLQLGHPSYKEGRDAPPPMSPSTRPIPEQHHRARPSRDQTASERQARVSRIPRCSTNDSGL